MTAPCKDCPDRTPECHSKCERYADFVKEREAYRRKRHEEAEIDYARIRTKSRAAYANWCKQRGR